MFDVIVLSVNKIAEIISSFVITIRVKPFNPIPGGYIDPLPKCHSLSSFGSIPFSL